MTKNVFTAFSGYDSQMMALRQLSKDTDLKFELVGWSEIEPTAIVAHNDAFPEYSDCNYGDISKINWTEVPDFDVFTYSFPCQAVSRSGKSEGIRKGSGTTSSLLWECERAIRIKRPLYCIMENVKALVTKQKTKKDDDTESTIMYEDFMVWEYTMCRLGYWNYLKVLDAADYGVPQHRERTIMVSIRKDNGLDPHYEFPPALNRTPAPVNSILEKKQVDEKNYLPDENTRSCIAILAYGDNGLSSVKMPIIDKDTLKNSHPVKKIITPTTRKGLATTLMASSFNGGSNLRYYLSTGNYPKTGVFEVWECKQNLEHEKVDWNKLSEKISIKKTRGIYNTSRKEICDSVKNLKSNQFIRLRGLTASECLRLMSVPKEYMDRMLDPEVKLKKLNYSEDAIKAMMTLSTTNKKTGKVIEKYITTNESALKKMAGNSIVVDMLYYIFRSLFIHNKHKKTIV